MTAYDPKHTALALLDLQPGILARVPDENVRAQVLQNNVDLLKAARSKGITVVFVRVAFTQQEFDAIPERNKVFGRLRKMGIENVSDAGLEESQASAQVHPDLTPQSTDIHIRKIRSCPFTTTDLHAQLQQRNIHSLILTGVATSNAVLAAARHAENRDYALTVVGDACADAEADVHTFVVDRLLSKLADVQTTEQTIQRILA